MEKVSAMMEKRLGNHPVIWANSMNIYKEKIDFSSCIAVRIQDGCLFFLAIAVTLSIDFLRCKGVHAYTKQLTLDLSKYL